MTKKTYAISGSPNVYTYWEPMYNDGQEYPHDMVPKRVKVFWARVTPGKDRSEFYDYAHQTYGIPYYVLENFKQESLALASFAGAAWEVYDTLAIVDFMEYPGIPSTATAIDRLEDEKHGWLVYDHNFHKYRNMGGEEEPLVKLSKEEAAGELKKHIIEKPGGKFCAEYMYFYYMYSAQKEQKGFSEVIKDTDYGKEVIRNFRLGKILPKSWVRINYGMAFQYMRTERMIGTLNRELLTRENIWNAMMHGQITNDQLVQA